MSFRPAAALGLAALLLGPAARGGEEPEAAPLADAAEAGDAAAVAALLTKSIDINAAQADGMTALHWAVYRDDADLAGNLLDAGADAAAATAYGVVPLELAALNGNGEIVRALLKAGADANAAGAGGATALHTAARTGRPGAVRALLEAGARVDARERGGQTPLMWAAAAGHAAAAGALIDAGADVRAATPAGFTPFLFAVREGRLAAARRLLDAGADVNAPADPEKPANKGLHDGLTPLVLATENGHFELAAALLGAGADPDDQRSGGTALHALTWVRKPLRGDGDPPPRGSGTLTSLQFARRLAAAGANLNTRLDRHPDGHPGLNKVGATSFLLAAEADDLELMQLLKELGADPALPNADGAGPLLAAAGVGPLGSGDEPAGTEAESVAAVRWLLDAGADVNAVDARGDTAMHGAAYMNHPAVVRLLAERGADPAVWDAKNDAGRTPFDIAAGRRPGNFRPSPETLAALREVRD